MFGALSKYWHYIYQDLPENDGLLSISLQLSSINSEYDREMSQSQTVDKPVALRGRATQQSRDTRKTNKAKQPALFPIMMTAKLVLVTK